MRTFIGGRAGSQISLSYFFKIVCSSLGFFAFSEIKTTFLLLLEIQFQPWFYYGFEQCGNMGWRITTARKKSRFVTAWITTFSEESMRVCLTTLYCTHMKGIKRKGCYHIHSMYRIILSHGHTSEKYLIFHNMLEQWLL